MLAALSTEVPQGAHKHTHKRAHTHAGLESVLSATYIIVV